MESSLATAARAAREQGVGAALGVARASGIGTVDGRVRAVILGSSSVDTRARVVVAAAGGTVEARYETLTQALIPVGALEQLAADPYVTWVRVPITAHPTAVAGEGVGASGASAWHAAGQRGAGVKVAIVDGDWTGFQQAIASGDLPVPAGTFLFGCSALEQPAPAGPAHGRQVSEIAYEMAPDVQLYFMCVTVGSANDTIIQVGQAKDQAKALGVHIINTSLGIDLDSRGDGTGGPGTLDGITRDARESGIFWVAGAGNSQRGHWHGTFADPDDDGQLNFSGTDELMNIAPGLKLAVNAEIHLSLTWNEWPVTSQDYDLYLYDAQTLQPLASSENLQTGSQPPRESLNFQNTTGAPVPVGVVIVDRNKVNGRPSTTPRLDLFFSPAPLTGAEIFEYGTRSGSVLMPAAAVNAFAVAGICWQNNRLEDYSSQGPTPDGRLKPDIAGQTAVSNSLFQSAGCPADANGNGGFFGTSAASPHVAGAAALVKGANPAFGPAQIQAFLEARALDLGDPGKDPLFGVGKLSLGAPPGPCDPRPRVDVSVVRAGSQLQATLAATRSDQSLRALRFGAARNGLITVPGVLNGSAGNVDVTLPAGTSSTTFFVSRQPGTSGGVTVPLTVVDTCGDWPTFVGSGPAGI